MNKLDNQSTDLIGDAYKNYEKNTNDFQLENPIDDFIIKTLRGEMIKIETEDGDDYRILTQEEFIDKIKTDDEFAQRWGVKVEVRELSLDERYVLANINGSKEKLTGEPNYTEEQQHSMLDELVPTKAISLTYDNRTEVIYE
jgi:hypothetical protein